MMDYKYTIASISPFGGKMCLVICLQTICSEKCMVFLACVANSLNCRYCTGDCVTHPAATQARFSKIYKLEENCEL